MKAIGIDHGDARVGVAIADDLGVMAHPLETITVKTTSPAKRIAAIVKEKGIEDVIIGLPRNMDGSYGPAAEKVRAFADKLAKQLPKCRVTLWDERLTSVAAQRALHEAGRKVKDSRQVIDQVAAVMILQGWMDSKVLLPPPPEEED